MGYKQPSNPIKMMKSAIKMHKAEKKAGMHRSSAMYMGHSPMEMGSPMYRESAELKDMPIVDIEKGDAKGDRKDARKEQPKSKREYGSPAKAAKPDYLDLDRDGNKSEPMKEAAKGSPAKEISKRGERIINQADKARDAYSKGDVKKGDRHTRRAKRIKKRDDKGHDKANKQGYNDRLDESLAKDGKESSKKQSMKDRRDESKGMEKSKGKGAYSSDPGMSRKSSPANMSKKAAERKVAKGKGNIEEKTGGKDTDARYVSNRRQKRASKAMDGTFKGFTKASKIKNKARKIK